MLGDKHIALKSLKEHVKYYKSLADSLRSKIEITGKLKTEKSKQILKIKNMRRVLIVGKPGSGKTTRMIEEARTLNPVLMVDEVVHCRRLEQLIAETEDFEISVVAVTPLPKDSIPENILQRFEIIDLDEENDLNEEEALKEIFYNTMSPVFKKLKSMNVEDRFKAIEGMTKPFFKHLTRKK